jgi:hypothetical protein
MKPRPAVLFSWKNVVRVTAVTKGVGTKHRTKYLDVLCYICEPAILKDERKVRSYFLMSNLSRAPAPKLTGMRFTGLTCVV